MMFFLKNDVEDASHFINAVVLYECYDSVSEPKEPPPKTYTMKDKFEYFKPCVQVEMDNPDKQETVTELYIRGQSSFMILRVTF